MDAESKIIEEARRFSSREEWLQQGPDSYWAARQAGTAFFRQCITHMARRHWADEELKLIARRFETRSSWQHGDLYSYQAARRRGTEFLRECATHMQTAPRKGLRRRTYTTEQLQALALKYESRGEWQRQDPYSYGMAWRRDVLEKCCQHMSWRGSWKTLHQEAK